MCGIVGFVGSGEATEVILAGLKRLEYRGYDSAGLAVIGDGKLQLRRSVGKIDNLETVVAESPPHGSIGIGHTRWATHGRPSEENAHPHVDCRGETVVIHNGIVENYLTLKDRLLKEGHSFASETDTEVIVHLIEENCRKGLNLVKAVRQSLKEIEGAHALLVMSLREPNKLIAAKIGNAGGIVVGVGEGEMYLASDMLAILNSTRRIIFLESSEMALVTADQVKCTDLEGNEKSKKPQLMDLDPIAAAKGGYKHFMLKEICEQPRTIADTLAGRLLLDPPGVYLEDFPFTSAEIQQLKRVTLLGCGTAWHAALVGKFLLEEIAGVPADVDYSSEFRYRETLLGPDHWVIAVTQSGETADTLESMELARSKGCKVLSIVNVVGSQASRIADACIYTHAGPETAVASTKAFTSQLVALHLLAIRLGLERGALDGTRARELIQSLAELPQLAGETLAMENHYEELANKYFKCSHFLYLGRGINYPIALEGALKLKEISYIHAEGYPAGEMKHGPIALIDEEMPVVAIASRDRVYSKVVNNIAEAKARGGTVIALVPEDDESLAAKVDHAIRVPAISALLAPILNAIPLQLLAYHFAVRRGCDVDQPRNLAKSVTVE